MDIARYLGEEDARRLLEHRPRIARDTLHEPGPDFVTRVLTATDRSPAVLRNLQTAFDHGRLAGSGYLSIFPVDHGIEHSAAAAFAKNLPCLDPRYLVEFACDAGCSAIASSVGVLGMVARTHAHRIPFIAKLNHNELLSYPSTYDQIPFASVEQAFDLGAVGVGATIYFGSPESDRQIREVGAMFQRAHELGLFTVLWAYLRNESFRTERGNYESAADLTGQGNHLGVQIQADIVKQKVPSTLEGFRDLDFGKTSPRLYDDLLSEHPVDLVRWQVACCFMGRVGLINSGGASGKDDFAEAVRTAVVNKRAGGMGVIAGRKAFQRPREDGIRLLNAIQDVYLDPDIRVA